MKKIFLTILLLLGFLTLQAQDFTSGMIAGAPGTTDKNGVYYYAGLDQKPDFPESGGNFMRLISDKVSIERFKGSPGLGLNISLSFIIEKDGTVSNAQVMNGHDAATVKEVMAAIKAIKTKWTPGKYNGKAVRTGMALTIFVPFNKSNNPTASRFDNEVEIVEMVPGAIDIGVEVPYQNEDDGVYISSSLQVQPDFPGGSKTFQAFVTNNIKQENLVPGSEGKDLKVYVSFVVEKDGSLSKIQILRDPGYGLGKEVERVIKTLKTKWSPGIQNGKPVRSQYTLPIGFRFPKEKIIEEIKAGQENGDLVMTPPDSGNVMTEDNTIYNSNMLQIQPEFPKGKDGLVNFINNNVKKENLEAFTTEKEINVFIQFIVEKDGTVTNHKIVEAPNTGIMKEVLRVLTSLKTRWKPGINNGKPVRALYSTQVIIKVPQQ